MGCKALLIGRQHIFCKITYGVSSLLLNTHHFVFIVGKKCSGLRPKFYRGIRSENGTGFCKRPPGVLLLRVFKRSLKVNELIQTLCCLCSRKYCRKHQTSNKTRSEERRVG